MSSRTTLKTQKGFSLIEILIVIGVIAVIALAAFIIYPLARDRLQAKQEAENIRSIQANVRATFFSKNGDYKGVGNGRGAATGPDRGISNLARAFPSSMNGGDYSRDAEIKSAWGETVWVWNRPDVNTPGGFIAANKSFGILYEKVPRRVCAPLVTAIASEFRSVNINGVEVQTVTGPNTAKIIEACNRESTNSDLILTST